MSYLNKIFQSIPVEIPDRSGFDLSHEVLSTAKCGTVVPITHFEVLPGDTISMGSLMKVTLPPMAVPFMGRIDAELTAAFIPNRLLWSGWQSFITQNNGNQRSNIASVPSSYSASLSPQYNSEGIPRYVPLAAVNNVNENLAVAGTLADYLGVNMGNNSSKTIYTSALPFLAYHKFCDDWVRDDNNMKPFFAKTPFFVNDSGYIPQDLEIGQRVHMLPHFERSIAGSSTETGIYNLYPETPQSDASSYPWDATLGLGSLRQRCWAKDYFTTATTRPQAGADSSVVFNVSGSVEAGSSSVAGTGQFTIATLRAANALQKWCERNSIAGSEYGDQIMSHFGVRPPDAVLNRSILLGSVRTPVYVGGVENNSGNGGSTGTSSPYGNVLGAAAGFASAGTDGSLIDNFTAKEHGFIMIFFTLIPHAYYNSGVVRSLIHRSVGDFAFPEFAGIGDQPIFQLELNADMADIGGADYGGYFGYNQRYSEYKFLPDRVSGLLREGQSLSPYALKRTFSSERQYLGSEFLEIPVDFLDQVLGVSSDVGGFGCMIDAWFDVKALRILPEYSLPHL